MSRAQLEKMYGIRIADDSWIDMSGRIRKAYKIYSADGCQWENGLRNLKAVERECVKWADALLDIKRKVLA